MASKSHLVDLDFGAQARVKGLQNPVDPQDAATKAYVDTAAGATSPLRVNRVFVDFGTEFTDKAVTVVDDATWADETSLLIGQIVTLDNTDPDEMRLLDFSVQISNILTGVGYTVTVTTEVEARGHYAVNIIGI